MRFTSKKENSNKLDFNNRIKIYFLSEVTFKTLSTQATDQEGIFAMNISGKWLLIRIYKVLVNINNKKINK